MGLGIVLGCEKGLWAPAVSHQPALFLAHDLVV